jgi:hypothetical protein
MMCFAALRSLKTTCLIPPSAFEAIERSLAVGCKSVVRNPSHGSPVGGFKADPNIFLSKTGLAYPEDLMGDADTIFDFHEGFSYQRPLQALQALQTSSAE